MSAKVLVSLEVVNLQPQHLPGLAWLERYYLAHSSMLLQIGAAGEYRNHPPEKLTPTNIKSPQYFWLGGYHHLLADSFEFLAVKIKSL